MRITIAIDGHSSTGKSTLAKRLAAALSYAYVDTGAMYRAVTLFAMKRGFFAADGELNPEELVGALNDVAIHFESIGGRNTTFLNGENVEEDIRKMDVSNRVSFVASIPEVRTAMVAAQREMGKSKGVVMDGRDVGTVVFPDAELKIFMTASSDIRAQRRLDELKSKGEQVSYEEVKANIEERDYLDENRKDSPLTKAHDAVLLDNSHISPDEQFNIAHQWAVEKIEG